MEVLAAWRGHIPNGQVNLRPDKTTAICFKMWYAHIADEKICNAIAGPD